MPRPTHRARAARPGRWALSPCPWTGWPRGRSTGAGGHQCRAHAEHEQWAELLRLRVVRRADGRRPAPWRWARRWCACWSCRLVPVACGLRRGSVIRAATRPCPVAMQPLSHCDTRTKGRAPPTFPQHRLLHAPARPPGLAGRPGRRSGGAPRGVVQALTAFCTLQPLNRLPLNRSTQPAPWLRSTRTRPPWRPRTAWRAMRRPRATAWPGSGTKRWV